MVPVDIRDIVLSNNSFGPREISQLMQQKRVRHVPVCDPKGRIMGMVSIGDVNAYHATNQEAHINFLSEYIYGRV